jgi:hypothetical protein
MKPGFTEDSGCCTSWMPRVTQVSGRRLAGRFGRWLALASAGVVASGLLVAVVSVGGPADATSGPAVRPALTCVSQRADARGAAAMAANCARPVEIMDRRTEVRSEFANPDGTTTLRLWAAPTRVRSADGGWAAVDTNLRRRPDGALETVATVNPLRLSGGGTGPLATTGTDRGPVSLSWPTPLPVPTVDGDVAVYAGVLPGVDLRVRALREGFTYVLVVHDRAAAANPALRELRLRLNTAGGSARARSDGHDLVDDEGRLMGRLGEARMWDSRGGGSTADEPGLGARTATPAVRVSKQDLTLTPDRDLLTDPDVVFPLYVDPPFQTPWNVWAYATSNNSSNSTDVARVGRNPEGGVLYRSFFRFPAWDLTGRTVIDARFHALLVHSWSCAATPVNLWSVADVPNGGRVGWSPAMVTRLAQRSANAHKGPDDCGYQPDAPMEFGGAAGELVHQHLQTAANAGWSWVNFGLSAMQAGGGGESTTSYWKKFSPGSVFITATLNRAPGLPAVQPVSDCYLNCTSPAATRSLQPELAANVSDPDAGTLRTEFEVWNAGSTTLVQASGSAVTGVPSGSVARWRLPTALTADTDYTWRVRSCDAYVCGAWTGWQSLRADATNPALPDVSSRVYLEDTTGTVNGGIGVAHPFTFTGGGSTDVVEYAWSLDGSTPVVVSALGRAAVTVQIAPIRDLLAVLQVTSRDGAGRVSSPRVYRFRVTPPPPEAGGWRLNETSGNVANDHVGSRPATRSGPVTWGAPGRRAGDTAARFASDSFFQTSLPVLSTSSSFSVAAWVRLTDNTGWRMAVGQDGTNMSMFVLQFRPDSNRFCFSVRAGDALAAQETINCAPTAAVTNQWVHLAGVHNAEADTVTLYVNGGDPDRGGSITVAPFSSPWAATGAFSIGRNRYDGANGGWWVGDIDEVLAFQRALPLEEVQFLSFN